MKGFQLKMEGFHWKLKDFNWKRKNFNWKWKGFNWKWKDCLELAKLTPQKWTASFITRRIWTANPRSPKIIQISEFLPSEMNGLFYYKSDLNGQSEASKNHQNLQMSAFRNERSLSLLVGFERPICVQIWTGLFFITFWRQSCSSTLSIWSHLGGGWMV